MIEDFNEPLGESLKGSEYVVSTPRKWTKKEIEWAIEQKRNGFSFAEIAEKLGRTEVSVFVKLKRESKSADTYNLRFREAKYQANANFLQVLKPKTVLDLYAGNSWWKSNVSNTTTNDLNKEFQTDYHSDAFDLLCELHLQKKRFDVIDLDPFGSAYECFDLAFRMAKKGIIISFGEWGHFRWRRTDFVSPRYGIHQVSDFSHEPFIVEAQRIARLHKKTAEVFDVLQYSNFLRIYFSLESFKETSQWEGKNE